MTDEPLLQTFACDRMTSPVMTHRTCLINQDMSIRLKDSKLLGRQQLCLNCFKGEEIKRQHPEFQPTIDERGNVRYPGPRAWVEDGKVVVKDKIDIEVDDGQDGMKETVGPMTLVPPVKAKRAYHRKKQTIQEAAIQESHSNGSSLVLTVDFSAYPEVFDLLQKKAAGEIRTLEGQVIYTVRRWVNV
jgi:hypothetical protein